MTYRDRIIGLEYHDASALTPHPGNWLSEAAKVYADSFVYGARRLFVKFPTEPGFGEVIPLAVVATVQSVAKGNNISLVGSAAQSKGYPVIGSNDFSVTGLTSANSTGIVPICQTLLPILGGTLTHCNLKFLLSGSVSEPDREHVVFPVGFSARQPDRTMGAITLSILSSAHIWVSPSVFSVPFLESFAMIGPILRGIFQAPFAFGKVAKSVSFGVLFAEVAIRSLLLLLDKFRLFLTAFPHVLAAVSTRAVEAYTATFAKLVDSLYLTTSGACLCVHSLNYSRNYQDSQ